MPEPRFHPRCPLHGRRVEPHGRPHDGPRDVPGCPDPARRARCELLYDLGGLRRCRLLTEPEPAEQVRVRRVDEWLALVGEETAAQALAAEPERIQQLFAVAVHADVDGPALAEWLVQASFDPDATLRRITGAAIAVVGMFVPARRREAHTVLTQARERGLAEHDAAIAALAATGSWDTSPGLRHALFTAAPEVRAAVLAAWAGNRLSGRALREQEWRRIAAHVHPGRRGERVLRRLRRARSTRDVRHLLQRLGERRGRRATTPAYAAISADMPAWHGWYDLYDYDEDDHDHRVDTGGSEAWPVPALSAGQQAAMGMLAELHAPRTWSKPLGERLSLAQRLELWRLHPDAESTLDVRVARLLADPGPLRTLAALESLVLARRHDPSLVRAIDVVAVLADLRLQLAAAAPGELQLRGEALRACADEPALARALTGMLPEVHPDQRALVMLAALCPEGKDATSWPEREVVAHLLQSGLAPLLMCSDPPRGLDPEQDRYYSFEERARRLLQCGAGSLHSLDYPEFAVTCRPSLSVVRPEHLDELREIGAALARLAAGLAADDPAALLAALDAAAEPALPPADGSHARLVAHACAYATLRGEVLRAGTIQIREAHIRRFEARRDELASPPPTTLAELRRRFGAARLVEGLAHAMLAFAREPPDGDPSQRSQRRRAWTHRLRLLALLYELPPAPVIDRAEPEATASALVGHLIRAFEHAPLELCQALHVPHQQGLPQLAGAAAPLERRLRRLLRRALQLEESEDGVAIRFTCRPLDKRVALRRGQLGHDCSSTYVPLRALSPHHVYYGLFTEQAQRPGYMTVFEAFAEVEDGGRAPVLVLETINVHDGALDGVQQDLLLLFDVIARARGLAGLVVVSGIGTWNYANERLVTAARRHRQGKQVRLVPADPSLWRAHELLGQEAGAYCAFRNAASTRLLAPFDAARDVVQPENAAEAARLAEVSRRTPVITACDRDGQPAAFITAIPGATANA